jgi:HD-GYP domain-containing protein (c-di-GMP phosphodiesterase class II)
MAGLLHDVGKFAVPEEILNKSTPLGKEGWEGIKSHSVAAGDILAHIRGLRTIIPIVKSIHENYDGTGYPDGLRGEEIPMEARIISVVDAYWAMRSPRPYRGAFSHKDALAAVKADTGVKYDPRVVDAFVAFCGKLRFKQGVRRLYVRSS